MKVLEFSLVSSCFLRCSFCPQSTLAKAYVGPKLMSLETFGAVLANAGSVDTYSFAGFAEPFLNRRCSEMILMAAATGRPVVVFTTAVGMDEKDVAALVRARVQAVTLHLPDGDGHMNWESTPRYLEVLTRLLDSGLDVRMMSMGRIHPAIVPIVGSLPPSPMQSRAGNVAGMTQIRKRGPLKCGPAPELDHPVVLPDGRVTVCCQSYDLRHMLGNLSTHRWEDIYAGEPFRELKAAMAAENGDCLCRGCNYAEAMR